MVVKDLSELTPAAKKACELFLQLCSREGLKVRVTETYRSSERQNELYAQGRTKPGKIVTWTKKSRHISRRAWDICQDISGREYSDNSFFKSCGAVAKRLGITWGGDWSTPDMPHFEVSQNWSVPKDYDKGEENMSTFDKRISELEWRITALEKNEPAVYKYTKDVPEWGRSTVQKLLDKGYYAGEAADDLNLSETMLRILVIMDRAGTFN